jgi:hypothetical protein
MTQFSILHPGDVAKPHGNATIKMCKCPGLLAGPNAHKKNHIGKFPATFWVKFNTYRRLLLLHSQ